MDAPYSRLSSPYLAWLVTRSAALSKISATNLYTSSSATSSRARITAPTATVVVSVCSGLLALSPLSPLPPLSPQATRFSAIIRARIMLISFFITVFSFIYPSA